MKSIFNLHSSHIRFIGFRLEFSLDNNNLSFHSPLRQCYHLKSGILDAWCRTIIIINYCHMYEVQSMRHKLSACVVSVDVGGKWKFLCAVVWRIFSIQVNQMTFSTTFSIQHHTLVRSFNSQNRIVWPTPQ